MESPISMLALADGNPRQKKHPLSPDLAPSAPSGAAEFSPGRKPWVGVAPSPRAPEGAKEGATAHPLTPLRGYGLIAGSVSQGSRPGLSSCGPPGLKPMWCSCVDLRHEALGLTKITVGIPDEPAFYLPPRAVGKRSNAPGFGMRVLMEVIPIPCPRTSYCCEPRVSAPVPCSFHRCRCGN